MSAPQMTERGTQDADPSSTIESKGRSRFFSRLSLFFLFVIVLTLPAMLSLFRSSGYWESHDGVFHLYRLVALENAWRQGHIYPRIFPEFAFGYGFTVLNFYGPLTYYVALIGRFIGLSPIIAMKATYALSYPLAAVGMWVLARELWRTEGKPNEAAGVIAAAVYTYVPYHLADVQLRGALAESWAFVWWGWLLWAAWRGRFLAFMVALAGLVLTHNLSVILIALPLAVWCFIAISKQANKRRYLIGMGAATLGAAALSAFYWLPVLLESRYVQISQDVGGLGFAAHLQPLAQWIAASAGYSYFPNQGVAGEHPLSWAQLAILAVSLIAGVWGFRRFKAVWLFGWITLIASLLLLSPRSFPLWEQLVFPFGLIQYPWRWLGITALASALVAGGTLVGLPRRATLVGYGGMGLLLFWLAWSGLANLPYQERTVDLARYPVSMWEEDAANGQVGATWTAEFLPLTVQEQRWALARAPEQAIGGGMRTPIEITGVGGDAFSLRVDLQSSEPAALSVSRFAYPSMSAESTAPLRVEPRGVLGVATVPLEPESSSVRFELYPLANNPLLALGAGVLPLVVIGVVLVRKGWRGLLYLGIVLFFWVGVLQLTQQPILYTSPESGIATIGTQAQLAAWKAHPVVVGHPLQVTLMWFNLEQTDQNFVTYIHLTPEAGGAPLAQHDSQPNMGTIPTTRWLAGQLVEDLHLLDIPADLPRGTYQLWAGMYQVSDRQAIPLEGDSGERRLLGTIEVTP